MLEERHSQHCEQLMLLMANVRHDMDDITLKNDMCCIKIDKNMETFLFSIDRL